jgi:hypothetical protein
MPSSPTQDNYTKHGAGVLAALVEKYWHERGHPQVKAERYALDGLPNTWGVRSNLVAGSPPATTSRHTMQQC